MSRIESGVRVSASLQIFVLRSCYTPRGGVAPVDPLGDKFAGEIFPEELFAVWIAVSLIPVFIHPSIY